MTKKTKPKEASDNDPLPEVDEANRAKGVLKYINGLRRARDENDVVGIYDNREMLEVIVQLNEHQAHRKLAKAALKLDELLMSFAWRTTPCGVQVVDATAA